MYIIIEKWLNKILSQTIPEVVVALNFNLYEDGNNNWSMELVGTESFDLDNEDWCCDEVFDFGTREHPLSWSQKADWEAIFEEMKEQIKKYLEQGLYANILKSYEGVGIGFVDGDIEILYVK